MSRTGHQLAQLSPAKELEEPPESAKRQRATVRRRASYREGGLCQSHPQVPIDLHAASCKMMVCICTSVGGNLLHTISMPPMPMPCSNACRHCSRCICPPPSTIWRLWVGQRLSYPATCLELRPIRRDSSSLPCQRLGLCYVTQHPLCDTSVRYKYNN